MYKIKIVFGENDFMMPYRRYGSFEEADADGPYWCRKAFVDIALPSDRYPTYEVVEIGEE